MFVGRSIKRVSEECRNSVGSGVWVFLCIMVNNKGSCFFLVMEKMFLVVVKIFMLRELK